MIRKAMSSKETKDAIYMGVSIDTTTLIRQIPHSFEKTTKSLNNLHVAVCKQYD